MEQVEYFPKNEISMSSLMLIYPKNSAKIKKNFGTNSKAKNNYITLPTAVAVKTL